MNKGNLNKLVTNYPVELTEEEIANLSGTLAPVIAACGGGGGGTGGKIYTGIGFVTVNNTTNQIGLTNEANTKLNQEIPSAVSSFPDSIQYAKTTEIPDSITDFADTDTVIYSYINEATASIQQQINGKQNKLQFDLNAKGEISAIGPLNNTTALVGANGITGDYYSASNPSGFINSAQAETQILEKHYLTEASGNARYIPIPEGLSDGQYYAYTTSSWKVIQGAGDVSGISTVAHDDTLTGNGNNENLGVDTTKIQTKLTDSQIQNITDVTTLKTASSTWDNVSAKLNTTDFNTYTAITAPSTYQEKGNYLSSNALEGYATTALLDTISSKIENDIPTTVAQLTDSGNYYQKTETSSKTEISTALGNKVDKPISLQNKYLVLRTNGDGSVSGWVDFNDNVYSKTEADGRYQKILDMGNYLTTAKYATDSATFYPTSNPDGYLTKTDTDTYYQPKGDYATSAGLTAGNQYAMTTTGWAVVQGGTSFTGVVTGTGLSGNGLSNSPLGIDTTAAINFTNGSAKSATSALSANKAGSAISAKWLRDDNASVSASDVTALQHWASSNSSNWNSVSAKLGTAQYALDSATFVTSSSNTITGTKQYALTTNGWSDIGLSAYLPLSGGTVSGTTIISGSSFDTLEVLRSGQTCTGTIGINGANGMSLKITDSNSNTQLNIAPNADMDKRFSIGDSPYSPIAYLIPAVTSTTTAGLTNDGILHIIVES